MPSISTSLKIHREYKPKFKLLAAIMLRMFMFAVKLELMRVLRVPYPPASRPGEAPRRRTGKLARSYEGRVDRRTGEGRMVIWAEYASYLERGTKRMEARPFFVKTVRRVAGWFGRKFSVGRYTSGEPYGEI